MILFVLFFIGFFHMEQQRQDELDRMQTELHKLRSENLRSSKRLLHANRRMLKYEAAIKRELGGGGGGGWDDDAEELDAPLDEEEPAGVEDEGPAPHHDGEHGSRASNYAAHHAAHHLKHAHPAKRETAPAASQSVSALPEGLRGQCLQNRQSGLLGCTRSAWACRRASSTSRSGQQRALSLIPLARTTR